MYKSDENTNFTASFSMFILTRTAGIYCFNSPRLVFNYSVLVHSWSLSLAMQPYVYNQRCIGPRGVACTLVFQSARDLVFVGCVYTVAATNFPTEVNCYLHDCTMATVH